MNKSEAHKILGEQLARFGSYRELVPLVESRLVMRRSDLMRANVEEVREARKHVR